MELGRRCSSTRISENDCGTTDGSKKRLLKWENQIVHFQKATGEVFSVTLKCTIVLSRSPAPIRTCLRVQNRGNYGALFLKRYFRPEINKDKQCQIRCQSTPNELLTGSQEGTRISQHLVDGKSWTIHSCRTVPVKKGECESTRCTSQYGTQPTQPR